MSDALKEEFTKQLDQTEERHLSELSQTEERFKKQLLEEEKCQKKLFFQRNNLKKKLMETEKTISDLHCEIDKLRELVRDLEVKVARQDKINRKQVNSNHNSYLDIFQNIYWL